MNDDDPELAALRRRRAEMLKRMVEDDEKRRKMPAAPITLTDSNFDERLKEHPLLIVDLWAPWCGPCKMIGPMIEAMAKEYQGKAVFGKLNVDQNQMTASRYKVQGIPTLLVFRNGRLVDRQVGALPKNRLVSVVERHLQIDE